jgi:hypothetical protein
VVLKDFGRPLTVKIVGKRTLMCGFWNLNPLKNNLYLLTKKNKVMLVKIDRDSIKKNPNAGNDKIQVSGPWHIDFVITGDVPDFLIEDVNCYFKSYNSKTKETEGALIDFTLKDKLLELKHVTVHERREIQTHYHSPEKEWLYNYENPLVECKECCALVPVNDIKTDSFDDDIEFDICPKCSGADTFEEIKYENINDILKTLNK